MKKVISLLLCLTMVMALSPFSGIELFEKASAEGVFSYAVSNPVSITDDGVEHKAQLTPWDGKASEVAPETTTIDGEIYYMIEDAADLAWFSNKVNKGNSSTDSTNRESNAILVNDIDLNGHNWHSYRIGQSYYFAGTFDGQGHTIYNLYLESSTGGSGFFGCIGITGKAATIKNVNFVNARSVSTYSGDYKYISASEMTSIVCGYMTAKDSLIENVSVSGKISVKSSSQSIIGAGSIVGFSKKGTIRNCYSDVNFDLANAKNLTPDYFSGTSKIYGVGGIIGVWAPSTSENVVESTITQCGFEGTINAPQNSRVGGIIGNISTYRYFSFSRCYSNATIIGYRQVGGIVGWAYDGISVYHSPLYMHSSSTVIAKTADNSYAAGIANGYRGDSITYPIVFMGDVKVDATVDGEKAPEFNNRCGLLFTSNAASGKGYWERLYVVYIPRYYGDNVEKHIISHSGTAVKKADHVTACTENDFKTGRAFDLLDESGKAQNFSQVEGLNNGLVVHNWYVEAPVTEANTYYVDNNSLDVKFDTKGFAEFEIAPIDGDVVVTISNDEKLISEKGIYRFKIEDTDTLIQVDGKAFVTKDIMNPKEATKLTDLSATQIRVSFKDDQVRDVVLALYKNNIFEDVIFNKETQPEVVNGESVVSAIIDLEGKDLTDYTLRGFLWESGTATPIEDSVYIGKPVGKTATDEEKAQAISAVAQSYIDRGESIQYDNASLSSDGFTRYEFGKSPEAYTLQTIGYVNGASFCYDLYKEAFGIELPKTSEELVNSSEMKVDETDSASLDEAYFENTVEAGDIIALDENTLMVYTGDDSLVYADGENYSLSYGEESYEADGAIRKISTADLFEIATDYDNVTVIRPFNASSNVIIPEKTINRMQYLNGVIVEKTASHRVGITAELGDEITYTFKIENKNDHDVTLPINDVIPQYTELVDGCDDVDGKRLRWDVTVGAGDTESVSYTVKVTEDSRFDGKIIESSSAKIAGINVPCNDIKIARTFKSGDISNIQDAIHAISHSQFTAISLAKMIYTVAFSKSFTMSGTPGEILHQIFVEGSGDNEDTGIGGEDVPETVVNFINMVVPTMFGGHKVGSSAETMIGSERSTTLSRENLIAGDFLLTQKNSSDEGKIYVYDGEKLVELSYGAYNVDDTDALLESLYSYDRFIVLRPSVSLNTFIHFEEDTKQDLTPEQEAVLETAKSYLLRGATLQYDDTRITASYDSTDEYRWQLKKNAPEDATSYEWGYTNCAAFTNDVYYFGLGFDVKTWSTDAYHQNSPASRVVYRYSKTGTETAAEKEAIQEHILEILEPGDVLVIKREDNSGHAMLYVGNERIIHSSGSNFNYSKSSEVYEATIRYRQVRDLFLEGDRAHIFGVVRDFDIIRPLNDFKASIPQQTKNRIANMKGIRAEKISSHTSSMTVNPGDEMTFTFSVYNANDNAVTLDVKDIIPSNTEYISGADKVEGSNVSWKITVMPEETVDVSYKVRVKESATEGTYVVCSKGSVGGVTVKCPDVKIDGTLTKAEQTSIAQAIESFKSSDLSGIALANAIYKNVFGADVFADYDGNGSLTNDDVLNATFVSTDLRPGYYIVNQNTDYGKMLAHPLFGGRYYYSKRWDQIRTRLPRSYHLMTGDILVEYDGTTTKLFIFDGETLRDLNNKMAVTDTNKEFVKAMSNNRFAVLRPSLVMD